MIQRRITRRPQQTQPKPPVKESRFNPSKNKLLEDEESLFTYDDEVPYDYDDEIEYPVSKPTPEPHKGPVGGQLERIEERLAKIERMLQQVLNQNAINNYSTVVPQQPVQQTPRVPQMVESVQPARGSMLGEIQAMIAQQGGVGPELGAMPSMQQQMPGQAPMMQGMPDINSSIATMSSAAYDDDVPNILGLD